MMEISANIIWAILFGMTGYVYFSYGRKQKAIVPLAVGIALFIFPYFFSNVYALVIVGVILIAIPYFVRY